MIINTLFKKLIFGVLVTFSFPLFSQTLKDSEDLADEKEVSIDSPFWEDLEDPFLGLTDVRKWREPQYTDQELALGWSKEAFEIPKGLEPQVQFWKRIYSELSQDQGLIHDLENVTRVYTQLNFSEINQRTDINKFRKEILRKALVEKEKKRIVALLKKFEKLSSPDSLPEEEKIIYNLFQEDENPKKFKVAQKNVRFQLGQKDKIIQGIFFSGRYLEEFEKIFKEEGLPIELTRLPFVESSFNIFARSRVGASGLWQLMPSVVLKRESSNPSFDIRNDPLASARIAARVLKKNYELLNSWPLAVTGYNHGPYGVMRLKDRCQSQELIEMADLSRCKGKRLGFASRNFYPSYLAVLEIEKKATQYYGQIFWSSPLNQVEVTVPQGLWYKELLGWFDNQSKLVELYNPHLQTPVRNNKEKITINTKIYVPREKLTQVRQWFDKKNQEAEVEKDLKQKRKKSSPTRRADLLGVENVKY